MGRGLNTASILILDDDPVSLSLLEKYIANQGYQVTTYTDPEAALTALTEPVWDLVLLDWLLPGMTGIQVLHRLRQTYPPGVLPVMMVTTREDSRDVIAALQAGANDYIVKPFDLPVVVARIQAQLATVRSVRLPVTDLLGGRYQVQQVLGQGGFSRTYLARDWHRPGAPLCVVKKLLSVATDEPEKLLRARRLFYREAQALELLGHHKNIPRMLAYFEQEGEFYLVEEFIEGISLQEQLATGQPWAPKEVLRFLKHLLKTLKFIHRHLVIHRDIKPDNIIYSPLRNDYVLIDFGAVRQILPQADVTAPTIAIGTRGYAPLEQLLGYPEFSSDLYALGMVCLQALTGLPPTELPRDQTTGELDCRPWLTPQTSHLLAILTGMTRYYPQDRYPSAVAVLRDVQKLESDSNPGNGE